MTILRKLMLLTVGLSLSACAAVDMPTRNAPFETLPNSQLVTPKGYEQRLPDQPVLVPTAITPVIAQDVLVPPAGGAVITVTSVLVRVPRELQVSEANRYLPKGDIVWREDPIGDRHAQVQRIVQAAIERGVAPLSGAINVALDVRITRFHALTEKARYTTGGVHAISFDIALKDPQTGALLMPVRSIRADLKAFGGQQALQAMARGETQKIRITNHLAAVIHDELTKPDGYKNANLGFIQMLNNI